MTIKRFTPCGLGRNTISLGKQGEVNALRIEFDCAPWLTDYPDATVKLLVCPPGGEKYFATLGAEDTDRVWIVDETATASAGNGVIELLLVDEATASTIKSATGYTTVKASPSAGLEAQESEPGYVRYDAAQELTDEQKAIARSNIGAGTGDGSGTGGADGEDGVSPVVEITDIDGGHRVSITDVEGTKTFDVMDGADGEQGPEGPRGETGPEGPQGPAGENGVGASASVTAITGGHRVTIVSASGTVSFDVMDGKDGAAGEGANVELDTTLTQSGKAADAKATGDALNELKEANAQQDTEIARKANDAELAKVAKSGSYTDLTNKPEIPTVPEALKNPNKLILTGAVTAEYDGSAPVSVEIPAGGGGNVSDEQVASAVESYLAANPIEVESHPLPASETSWGHPELDIANDYRIRNAKLLSTEGNLAHNACITTCGDVFAAVWAENTGGGSSDNANSDGNVHSRMRLFKSSYWVSWKISSGGLDFIYSDEIYDLFPAGTEITGVDGSTYTVVSDSDNMVINVDSTLHIFAMVYGSDKKKHIVHTSGTPACTSKVFSWTPSGVFTEVSLVVDGESGKYDFTRINSDWINTPQINTKPVVLNTTAHFTLSINGKGIAFMTFDTSDPTVWTYNTFLERNDIHLEVCLAGGHYAGQTAPYWVVVYRTKNGYVRLIGLNSSYGVKQEFILPGCNTRPRVYHINRGKYVLFCGADDRGKCTGYLYDVGTDTMTLAKPLKFFNTTTNITDYVDVIPCGSVVGSYALAIVGTNQKAVLKKGVSFTVIHSEPSFYTNYAERMFKVLVNEAPVNTLTLTGAVEATFDGSKAVSVEIPSGGSEYTLPVATSTTLGGVKVGNGLAIDKNGVLSLNVSNASGVSF